MRTGVSAPPFSYLHPASSLARWARHEPGSYVINADGTGFHEVAGPTTFAPFFGLTPVQVAPDGYLYGWNGTPFGLSGDGSKLVCFVWTPTNGYRLVGLTSAG